MDKEREWLIGERFITEYNSLNDTDFELRKGRDANDFPDLLFISKSDPSKTLQVEVVKVVISESYRRQRARAEQLRESLNLYLIASGLSSCEVAVALDFWGIPRQGGSNSLAHRIGDLVIECARAMNNSQCKIDCSNVSDGRFRDVIKSLNITKVPRDTPLTLRLVPSKGIRMDFEMMVLHAIEKKITKYSAKDMRDVILLLDCVWPALGGDLSEELPTLAHLRFKEVYIVNTNPDHPTLLKVDLRQTEVAEGRSR